LRVNNPHGVDTILFANEQVPVESAAVTELIELLDLQDTVRRVAEAAPDCFDRDPGIVRVAVTPDFHKARGIPVGTVLATRGFVVPQAIGNDINCGMRLHVTGLTADRIPGVLGDLETALRSRFFEGVMRSAARLTYREVGEFLEKPSARHAERLERLRDRLTALHGVYGALDALLLCSDAEGLPQTVVEALCAGLPVLATAVGGVPELVADEVNGLLVPRGDVAALSAALRRLLADARLRARLGRAAVMLDRAPHAAAAVGGRLADLYDELHRAALAGAPPTSQTSSACTSSS